MKVALKRERAERLRRNETKWTPALMEAGWTVLPSVILERQHDLGLDAIDVNILMQLARYWWFGDNPPHPSKKAIAECIGVDRSTVRRHIAKMETLGYIRRAPRFNQRGQDTNVYHFDGLIKHATPFALEALEARKRRRAEEEARRKRRRPRLAYVNVKVTKKT